MKGDTRRVRLRLMCLKGCTGSWRKSARMDHVHSGTICEC